MKRTIGIAFLFAALLAASVAGADNPSREAGRHFQRGVELYNDGDFRGALVEFKKAYSIWPRANVLYDIGQAEYQLLDYANALKTMERYLSETGPNAAHRSEVENTVETLRGRVGRVVLATDAGGCDVSIDDQPAAGTTPLDAPLLVSVGTRKITVTCPGRGSASRHIEVAAGETAQVELKAPAPLPGSVRGPTISTTSSTPKRNPKQSAIIAWSLTGVLLAGVIGVGTAAVVESRKLDSMKHQFPVTKDALDRQSSLTTGLAVSADVLAAATVAVAGVSTYLTVKYMKERRLRVNVSTRGVSLAGTF